MASRFPFAVALLFLLTACDLEGEADLRALLGAGGARDVSGTSDLAGRDLRQTQEDAPSSVDIGSSVDSGSTQTGEGCHTCIQGGTSFRISGLEVTQPDEPSQFPSFLNGIWQTDVAAYRLNILLVVTFVEDNGDGTKTLTLGAGSAWHDLSVEDVLPVQGGATPSEYHVVGPGWVEFQARLETDCSFETLDDTGRLLLHPGPNDYAMVCSDGDDSLGLPRDTLPIENLLLAGSISDDCRNIVEGTLEGCLREEAAGKVCMFFAAPDYSTWSHGVDESVDPVEPFDASYCQRWCDRTGWTNFGSFTRLIQVPLGCHVGATTAADGYSIAADFQAEGVSLSNK